MTNKNIKYNFIFTNRKLQKLLHVRTYQLQEVHIIINREQNKKVIYFYATPKFNFNIQYYSP